MVGLVQDPRGFQRQVRTVGAALSWTGPPLIKCGATVFRDPCQPLSTRYMPDTLLSTLYASSFILTMPPGSWVISPLFSPQEKKCPGDRPLPEVTLLCLTDPGPPKVSLTYSQYLVLNLRGKQQHLLNTF